MLVVVIMLLIAILVNVHRTKTLNAGTAAQEKEKEPEEHDERFATSKFVKYLYTLLYAKLDQFYDKVWFVSKTFEEDFVWLINLSSSRILVSTHCIAPEIVQ